ncbi:hypothetical protein HNY73_005473 [Argiope bruennichi]|uniref:Uncharacterized protein n=1 Tax=Argiope bruennichi TaxID=94029 RepID=A0A8T0FGP6_ARGBR|nr:hypothetical protein HNY73_005473 [Argiope bruennichi]
MALNDFVSMAISQTPDAQVECVSVDPLDVKFGTHQIFDISTIYQISLPNCIRYKTTNQKPADLLQTPVPSQRFESIAIDLFGPLAETSEASCAKPDEPLGVYHASTLTSFQNVTQNQSPVMPLRQRDRPPKQPSNANDNPGTNAKLSNITPPRRDGLRRCMMYSEFSISQHVGNSSVTFTIFVHISEI